MKATEGYLFLRFVSGINLSTDFVDGVLQRCDADIAETTHSGLHFIDSAAPKKKRLDAMGLTETSLMTPSTESIFTSELTLYVFVEELLRWWNLIIISE